MPLWIVLLFLATVFIIVMGFVISSQSKQITELKQAKMSNSVPNIVFSQDASQLALEEWNSPPVKSTTNDPHHPEAIKAEHSLMQSGRVTKASCAYNQDGKTPSIHCKITVTPDHVRKLTENRVAPPPPMPVPTQSTKEDFRQSGPIHDQGKPIGDNHAKGLKQKFKGMSDDAFEWI
jgi:hypothetical protein